MNKIKDFLKTNFYWIVILLLMMNIVGNCSNKKKIKVIQKQVETISSNIYTKEELDSKLQIYNLKLSKNILFDWNAVVRTAIRPDDRINEYDKEIEKLSKK